MGTYSPRGNTAVGHRVSSRALLSFFASFLGSKVKGGVKVDAHRVKNQMRPRGGGAGRVPRHREDLEE